MADPVTLATLATIGKAAAGAGALFSGISALRGGPKAPPPVTQPGATPADRERAKRKGEDVQRRQASASVGRRETILTTPLGATGEVRTAGRTVLGR